MVGRVRVPDPVAAATVYRRGGRNGDMPYSWDAAYPARIGVMPRDGGDADVRWFDIDSCYVFHTLGAWDECDGKGGRAVVVDAIRHRRMFVADSHGPSGESPQLHRWRLDLGTGAVTETVLRDRGQEFPRADERLLGRRHRFAYAVATGGDHDGSGIFGDTVLRPGGRQSRGEWVLSCDDTHA